MQDDLIMRLKMVENHDWRVSFLAHTSDTARFAREELTRLRAAVDRLTRERDGARESLQQAKLCMAASLLNRSQETWRKTGEHLDAAIRALENPNG